MCEMMNLHGALCFEAQAEQHYRREAAEMNWFAWKFWMLRARIWRAACKALQRLGLADLPF